MVQKPVQLSTAQQKQQEPTDSTFTNIQNSLLQNYLNEKKMALLITQTTYCLGQKLLKGIARFLLKNHNSFFNVQFIKIYLESPLLCRFLLFYALMFECLLFVYAAYHLHATSHPHFTIFVFSTHKNSKNIKTGWKDNKVKSQLRLLFLCF